jgi:hypothetical protein
MHAREVGGRLAAGGLTLALACMPASTLAAAGDGEAARPSTDAHVRTSDTQLRAALDDGIAHSATFQQLVARIESSDVVVFVVYDRKPGLNLASRVTFVSAAGGRRYVMIGLRTRLPRVRQVSILAHELQHVVEIADAPGVVDAASMARYYAGLKYAGVVDPSSEHRFESRAAIDAENRVTREMRLN